jgi:hypothetical protein
VPLTFIKCFIVTEREKLADHRFLWVRQFQHRREDITDNTLGCSMALEMWEKEPNGNMHLSTDHSEEKRTTNFHCGTSHNTHMVSLHMIFISLNLALKESHFESYVHAE